MTLIFNRATEGPGTHAFIVAVGGYPSHPALGFPGAFESGEILADWLRQRFRNPTAELASIDFFASEPGKETSSFQFTADEREFDLERPFFSICASALLSWRQRLNSHPDNIALFYFIGRGAGQSGDTLLLMDDIRPMGVSGGSFAASFNGLVAGMEECDAERQLFLVDTCRGEEGVQFTPQDLLPPPRFRRMQRRAIFYAAAPGGMAFIDNREAGTPGASLFLDSLLDLMAIGQPVPDILTPQSLAEPLRQRVAYRASALGVDQQVDVQFTGGDFDFYHLRPASAASASAADDEPVPSEPVAGESLEGEPPPGPATGDAPAKKARAKRKAPAAKAARAKPPPSTDDETGTDFVLDDAEAEHDELGRGVLAIALARRLHKIWRKTNAGSADADSRAAFVVHLDAPWGGGKTTFANFLAHALDPLRRGRAADFLREHYPDVDVGGIFIEDPPADDDSLAKLAALPAEARRPWIVIPFNAWRVEHCSPPWWVFYQAIRKGCFDAVFAEGEPPWHPAPRRRDLGRRWLDELDFQARRLWQRLAMAWHRSWLRRMDLWLDLWFHELWWRLRNPKIATLILTAAISASALLILQYFDVWGVTSTSRGSEAGFRLTDSFGVLLAGLTGVTALWGFGALFTESIIPGTDSLAERLSLGSGDPFARFRTHFAETMKRVRRPVMVIVDDIDRCHPAFVVDLIRGMQTLLRSPRVVFVIVGDRDWIERAFEKHHEAMSKLDVGPEQTFGARFVEKAIQMSFILPALAADRRTLYVRRVLLGDREAGAPAAVAPAAAAAGMNKVREITNRAASAPDRNPFDSAGVLAAVNKELAEMRKERPDEAPATEAEVEQIVNETLATRATSDDEVEKEVRHELEKLAACFPANPRQIKRIVNTITLYYAVALQRQDIEPNAAFRHQLALWVIVMTEWPQTWRLLASYPDLVDLLPSANLSGALRRKGLRLPGSVAATRKALEQIQADKELIDVICGRGEPGHVRLESRYVRTLAELTPLYTRKRRLADEKKQAAAPAAT